MIKSKLSFINYIGLIAAALLFGVMVFAATRVDFLSTNKKVPIPNIYLLLFLFLLFFVNLYYTVKQIPKFIIADKKIFIKRLLKKKIELDSIDISSINLFVPGKTMNWKTIVTKIELVNDKGFILPDPNYRNTWQLKQALVDNFPEKIKYFRPSRNKDKPRTYTSSEIKFSGNPYLSLNGVFIFGFIAVILILFFTGRKFEAAHLFGVPPVLVFLYLFAWQLHYFIVTDEHFIIKNHFLPWISKKWLLDDIIVMNFETPVKMSQSLRVTTKDFKSRFYPAGSLRDKTWKNLQNKIADADIPFVK